MVCYLCEKVVFCKLTLAGNTVCCLLAVLWMLCEHNSVLLVKDLNPIVKVILATFVAIFFIKKAKSGN